MKIHKSLSRFLSNATAALVIGVSALSCQNASALTVFTDAAGDGGLWTNAANWSNGVPSATDGAFIVLNNTVTLNAAAPNALDIFCGQGGGTGTLLVNAGASLTVDSDIHVGWSDAATATGTYIQTGGSVAAANLDIGRIGSSTAGNSASISGGTLTAVGAGVINIGEGSNSSMTVSGGTVSAWDTKIATGGGQAHSGSLAVSGGSYTVSSFVIGDGGTSVGSLIIGGTPAVANVTWSGYVDLRTNSTLEVIGSGDVIKGTRPGNDGLIVNSGAEVKFTLDSSGISAIDLDDNGATLTLNTGAILTVDGSAFTGSGIFELFSYSSIAGTGGGQFSTVNFTGFAVAPTLNYGANSMTLNVVPEPSAWAMFASGLAVVTVLRRRRTLHR